jgi:hypothetical protein
MPPSKTKADNQFPPTAFARPQEQLDATVRSTLPCQIRHEVKAEEPLSFCEGNPVHLLTTKGARHVRSEIIAECLRVAQIHAHALRPLASRVLLKRAPDGRAESGAGYGQKALDLVVTFAKKA